MYKRLIDMTNDHDNNCDIICFIIYLTSVSDTVYTINNVKKCIYILLV